VPGAELHLAQAGFIKRGRGERSGVGRGLGHGGCG
jgi:hypothetical protein